MSAVERVFACDDLRKYILTFLINKRCNCCHNVMLGHNAALKLYNDPSWCKAENKRDKRFCNWCYYYVFEYEIN